MHRTLNTTELKYIRGVGKSVEGLFGDKMLCPHIGIIRKSDWVHNGLNTGVSNKKETTRTLMVW